MLVITRKTDESVILELKFDTLKTLITPDADNALSIEVAVLGINKDRVKLGVKAPREVKVVRSELRALQTENVEASKSIPKSVIDALLKQ